MLAKLARQIVELPLGAATLELPVVDRADPGRIIAAIFEPLQPVEQPLRDVARADNSNDSTHSLSSSYAQAAPCMQNLCIPVNDQSISEA
jgi:hypothetical protein